MPHESALVRMGEEVIVNIMAWPDDNGCPGREEPCAGSSTSAAGHGPAPSEFLGVLRCGAPLSRCGFAGMSGRVLGDLSEEREKGGRRVFPSPGQGEDRR